LWSSLDQNEFGTFGFFLKPEVQWNGRRLKAIKDEKVELQVPEIKI